MEYGEEYIEFLKLGFDSKEGISMNEIVKYFNIDLEKDISFKINYSKIDSLFWKHFNYKNKIEDSIVSITK